MNLYLLSLMIYLVLITPLRLSLRIRLGRRSGYMLRIQAIGLPFYKSKRDEDPADEQPIDQQEVTQQLKPENLRLLRSLINKKVLRLFLRAAEMRWLSLYVHISQTDAMQNALLYGSLRTAAETASRLAAGHFPLRIHLRTDYQGCGSEALLRCIINLRVGSLLPVALAWLWHMAKLRAERESSKEEDYAASH